MRRRRELRALLVVAYDSLCKEYWSRASCGALLRYGFARNEGRSFDEHQTAVAKLSAAMQSLHAISVNNFASNTISILIDSYR